MVDFYYGTFYRVFGGDFQLGMAPMGIGVFFFAAVQLFFIGIIGEYIGVIYTQVKKRPLIIEKERINFDPDDSDADFIGLDSTGLTLCIFSISTSAPKLHYYTVHPVNHV